MATRLTTPAARHRRAWPAPSPTGSRGTRDWAAPAPVAGWTARDVVGHLVEWFPGFLAGGGVDARRPAPPSTTTRSAPGRTSADAVQALLDDPATADRVLANPHIGELPLDQAIDRFYTADVFMHTWDLARATGQDDRLDPELCARAAGRHGADRRAAAPVRPVRPAGAGARRRRRPDPAARLHRPRPSVGSERGVDTLNR